MGMSKKKEYNIIKYLYNNTLTKQVKNYKKRSEIKLK